MGDGGSHRHGGSRVRPAHAPALIFERQRTWSPEAAAGLACTFRGRDRSDLIAAIDRGELELWKIDGGASWAVTRIAGDELLVECYQGRAARRACRIFFAIARRNHLRGVVFLTEHKALPRLLAGFGFEQLQTIYRAPVAEWPTPAELAA